MVSFATLNAHVDPEPNNISCFYSRLLPQASVPHTGHGKSKTNNKKWFRLVSDSSILALFLPEPDIPHPSELPPTDPIHLDPKSDEYFEKVCTALELDGPLYSHLDPKLLEEFKALVKKYSEIFYLTGSPPPPFELLRVSITILIPVLHLLCTCCLIAKVLVKCVLLSKN